MCSKIYLWRRNIRHTLSCPSILTLAATTHTWKSHTRWGGRGAQREGRAEGSVDIWMERQTWWIYGGPEVSRPCGVVGIAVMLIDAWLFASAFTVNTKKAQERKRQQWEQMRKPAESIYTMMQSHHRNCWKRATEQKEDIWKRFTDTLRDMQKEEYLYHHRHQVRQACT